MRNKRVPQTAETRLSTQSPALVQRLLLTLEDSGIVAGRLPRHFRLVLSQAFAVVSSFRLPGHKRWVPKPASEAV